MLFTLVADYMRQQALRERFDLNPDAVFDEYQISLEDREALRKAPSMEELKNLLHRDVDNLGKGTSYFPMWSVGKQPLSFQPLGGPIHLKIPFTVTGTGFQPGALLMFSNPGGGNVQAGPSSVSPNGKQLKAVAEFTVVGMYNVSVKNPDGTVLPCTMLFNALI